jgi:hypothetical protein
MFHRWLTVAASTILLVGCHGIEHTPTGPSAPTRSTVPVRLSIVQSPGELPAGGGSAALIIEALGSDGGGVAAPVTLEVTGGELAADHVTTDSTGHASGSWAGTSSATLTARAGDVISVSTIRVLEPTTLPPPSVPPQPTPTPNPEPLPTPAPALSMVIGASPLQIAAGTATTLSVSVSNLRSGESVTAYQWDYEGTGKGTTFNETTVTDSRSHVYATDGIRNPIVQILTSAGRSATGSGRVIVFKP